MNSDQHEQRQRHQRRQQRVQKLRCRRPRDATSFRKGLLKTKKKKVTQFSIP